MNPSSLLAAAKGFRDLVLTDPAPSVVEVSRHLDALLLAAQDEPEMQPSESDLEAPARDYNARYAELRERFPDLSLYAVADPLVVSPPEQAMVGDAIDDLTDIIGDLEEGLWLAEHVHQEDGVWCLRCSWEIHWGRHARELSLYLHALRFG